MLWSACLALSVLSAEVVGAHGQVVGPPSRDDARRVDKKAFIEDIVSRMTVEDLVLQLHLMFGDDIVGAKSQNELYDQTMRLSPDSPIGVMHDWYPLNTSHYNSVQKLNLEKAKLKVPLMHIEECLHGVGSFRQSIFPQSLGLSASWDTDLVQRVGRAIGTEARSIGIHACLAPVLDLGQDPRWGRMQEAWGEDKILTSHMGVAYSSGLSKNDAWSDDDAVVPILKHFAAHGSPQEGHNAAPFMGHGNRQVLQELLTPFKAAIQLGGARGVLMAYNEFDDVPASVNPVFYKALKDWGFDGFTIADDTGMAELFTEHKVADSPADAIRQWFTAGGMIQFYDFPLETYLEATKDMIANKTLDISVLRSHVTQILGVKWDLGLFDQPFIPDDIQPAAIVERHRAIALEAAQKSIVLLENRNKTLPLRPAGHGLKRIALIGPFGDILNYGDYAGSWGQYPATGRTATTIREGLLSYAAQGGFEVVAAWGANDWEYNGQYVIPPYLLSTPDGVAGGGLAATYFSDTNFSTPVARRVETPALDWGIYPPAGLPSNNFSAVWEGHLHSPVDIDVDGWLGVAIGPNSTVRLSVDGTQILRQEDMADTSTITGNIPGFAFTTANGTAAPAGATPFTFRRGKVYKLRIEFQTFNKFKKTANINSLNAQLLLFWNLVAPDAARQAEALARSADLVVLAVGAAWNSDGESGDRATLGLAPSQDALARAIYAVGKPVVLVLEGGRPFAIDEFYAQSAAVLSAFFPGQAGGQAVADVLFGSVNPAGRMPVSVPRHVGQLPVYYNYKPSTRRVGYVDMVSTPAYSFGYGLSYTEFAVRGFEAKGSTFSAGDTIQFVVRVANIGDVSGSYVAQVYSLSRVSSIVQPVRQLVAFQKVDIEPGHEVTVEMALDVDRYLAILNRAYEWEVEKGVYTFALLDDGGATDSRVNVTMRCV